MQSSTNDSNNNMSGGGSGGGCVNINSRFATSSNMSDSNLIIQQQNAHTANASMGGVVGGQGDVKNGNEEKLIGTTVYTQEELEAQVNQYFSRLYNGETTANEMLELIKKLTEFNENSKEYEVYVLMLRTLFNECRFFPKISFTRINNNSKIIWFND